MNQLELNLQHLNKPEGEVALGVAVEVEVAVEEDLQEDADVTSSTP